MSDQILTNTITDQTKRALWEVKNVIDCVPEAYWETKYCEMPMWKHIYHLLHSLDLWFINPCDKEFKEPAFHKKHLNNLDVITADKLTRKEIEDYYYNIERKVLLYLGVLCDEELSKCPKDCEYNRFTLMMAQHRHLHTHMGIIMGFIIEDTGLWPRVVGLEGQIPRGEYNKYF